MEQTQSTDLAGLVRCREAADAKLKAIAAEVVKELLASPEGLPQRLAELRQKLIEAATDAQAERGAVA